MDVIFHVLVDNQQMTKLLLSLSLCPHERRGFLSPNPEQELSEKDAISHALGADFSADRSVR